MIKDALGEAIGAGVALFEWGLKWALVIVALLAAAFLFVNKVWGWFA